MKVYRCCEDTEIEKILAGKVSETTIGRDIGKNNHQYQPGVRYIHLFKFAEDACFFKRRSGQRVEGFSLMKLEVHKNYIAEYDVPKELLNQYRGLGQYEDFHDNILSLEEYAIPLNEFDFSWLVGYSEGVKRSQLRPIRHALSQMAGTAR